jgi:hypothetical protein
MFVLYTWHYFSGQRSLSFIFDAWQITNLTHHFLARHHGMYDRDRWIFTVDQHEVRFAICWLTSLSILTMIVCYFSWRRAIEWQRIVYDEWIRRRNVLRKAFVLFSSTASFLLLDRWERLEIGFVCWKNRKMNSTNFPK